MRLVDDHELDFGPLAARERLNRADLDRLVAIGARVETLHYADRMDALGFERGDGGR